MEAGSQQRQNESKTQALQAHKQALKESFQNRPYTLTVK